jgi:hypothetical protein
MDAHEDNRPWQADYSYSYYATEMRAIPNHKKTNLTYEVKKKGVKK